MVTTIQISEELKEKLGKRKLSPKDSYEEVIWDMYEDTMELSAATKKTIEQGRKEFAEGKTQSMEDVAKELGL